MFGYVCGLAQGKGKETITPESTSDRIKIGPAARYSYHASNAMLHAHRISNHISARHMIPQFLPFAPDSGNSLWLGILSDRIRTQSSSGSRLAIC